MTYAVVFFLCPEYRYEGHDGWTGIVANDS